MSDSTASDRTPSDGGRLLIDVGGTNVRFGISQGGVIDPRTVSYRVSEFATFDAALAHFLTAHPPRLKFRSAAIAAAGPVLSSGNDVLSSGRNATSEGVKITNTEWYVSPHAIRSALAADVPVHLLNDLEAVACALPYIPQHKIKSIKSGAGATVANSRKLAINIGTGFGSATLIETRLSGAGRFVTCPAESGHMLLATGKQQSRETIASSLINPPGASANVDCLEILEELHGAPLTVESVLSGMGVQRVAAAIRRCGGQDECLDTPLKPIDLTDVDPITRATHQLFSRFLAETAANLALASAAWGGVYFCGSVATAWARSVNHDQFSADFVGTTSMRHMLTATPIGIIEHELPSFIGLANIED